MISALNNQQIARRSRQDYPRISQKYKVKKSYNSGTVFKRKASQAKKTKKYGPIQKTLFTILGILFLIFTFSTSLLFSLSNYTHSQPNDPRIVIPQESHLGGSPELSAISDMPLMKLPRAEKEPDYPHEYKIQSGDSLYGISKEFDISLYDLLRLNKITEPRKLAVNTNIILPPKVEEKMAENANLDLKIKASTISGIAPLTTRFSVSGLDSDENMDFLWVFGNDTYGFEKSPEKIYKNPGTYNVYLVTAKQGHQDVISNSITITIGSKERSTQSIKNNANKYITLNGINEKIDFSQNLGINNSDIDLSQIKIGQNPPLLEKIQEGSYLSVKAGYSNINISTANQLISQNIFVSPFESIHSQDRDYDWYKTQFATGVVGNCGPSCVAMAVYWSRGKDVSVAKIRQIIGLPYRNGGLDWEHLQKGLNYYGISFKNTKTLSPQDLRNVIDRGNIAIVGYNTSSIKKTKGDPRANLVGRYYNDLSGHYIIVKGYSKNFDYFIVYDPIPSDWKKNDKRYGDGQTMLGKNRYYPAAELFKTMKRQVIEIKS